MLPNMWSYIDPDTQFSCELTPPVDMKNVTEQDALNLKANCHKDGFDYYDALPRNQGWYKASHWRKPEQVVIDPGAISRIITKPFMG